jgi:hypothetical protein
MVYVWRQERIEQSWARIESAYRVPFVKKFATTLSLE